MCAENLGATNVQILFFVLFSERENNCKFIGTDMQLPRGDRQCILICHIKIWFYQRS